MPIPESLRRRLDSGPGGGRGGVIVGMRPEDFEDSALVNDPSRGLKFNARIDVLESMGSEYYAYFVVESEKVASRELEELAADAGGADLPQQEGNQIVARLDAASSVKQGQDTELWFNAEHLHLFDPESGKSLLGSDGSGPSAPAAPPQTASQPAPGQPAPSEPPTQQQDI